MLPYYHSPKELVRWPEVREATEDERRAIAAQIYPSVLPEGPTYVSRLNDPEYLAHWMSEQMDDYDREDA